MSYEATFINSFCIFFFFFFLLVEAQVKEFIVIDLSTKEPVRAVSVFFSISKEGSVTNDEGKVKVYFSNNTDTLVFSHVGYDIKKIQLREYSKLDTIKLKPSSILLNEVAVYSLDLKKKLSDLLKKHEKLYLSQPVIYDCTYKESVKVNDTLARLAQVQLKWFDKNYKFDFTKPFDKQNQVSLYNIDYSKIVKRESVKSGGGYLDNSYLFKLLHLNFYPIIVNRGSDITIQSVNKYDNYTKVIFNTPIVENGKIVMFLNDGIIYFDNDTGAIIEIDFNYLYNNQIYSSNTKEKIPYTSQVKKHHIKLSFKKFEDNKWVISSLKSVIGAEVNYNNKNDDLQITQEFLITKTNKGGQIPIKEQIDLTKPFFENLPLNKNLDSKILLTREEEAFINKKN